MIMTCSRGACRGHELSEIAPPWSPLISQPNLFWNHTCPNSTSTSTRPSHSSPRSYRLTLSIRIIIFVLCLPSFTFISTWPEFKHTCNSLYLYLQLVVSVSVWLCVCVHDENKSHVCTLPDALPPILALHPGMLLSRNLPLLCTVGNCGYHCAIIHDIIRLYGLWSTAG